MEETPQPESTEQAFIILGGFYEGKNLFVQNPIISGGAYCVIEATVNGNNPVGIESSAFEINLQAMQLKIGDPVRVVITHHKGCKPKVLNPDAIHGQE